MPTSRPETVARIAFWPAFIFAFVMAVLPKPPELPSHAWGDKWEHALAFFVLTILSQAGYGAAGRWRIAAWLSAFGALIEFVQMIPVLHRDADLRDWIVDTAVVLLVSFLAMLADRIRNRRG